MEYKEKRNRSTAFKISMTAIVKLLILNILSAGEVYGNKLIDDITLILKEKWSPSPGMMYPLLRQLEAEGYIIGRWTDPIKKSTRYYKITDEGLNHYLIIKKNYEAQITDSVQILESIINKVYT